MKLKDRVFDGLRGTYGQTIKQIVSRFQEDLNVAVSAEHVEAAIEELIQSGRVVRIESQEDGPDRFRCNLPDPTWLPLVRKAIEDGLEECWPGGLSHYFVPEDNHLCFYPAPFDAETEDGVETGYPHFFIDLKPLMDLFDSIEGVHFTSRRDVHLSIEGTIGGEEAWVEVNSSPQDEESIGIMRTDGSFEPYGFDDEADEE